MNSLSTATIEREVRDIPQDIGLLEDRAVSLDWETRAFEQTESELWDLLIALASNDDEAGTLGLAPTLRRLRELGARLVCYARHRGAANAEDPSDGRRDVETGLPDSA